MSTYSEAVRALRAAGIKPDVLNWIPADSTLTRGELLEAGELTIEDIIREETE